MRTTMLHLAPCLLAVACSAPPTPTPAPPSPAHSDTVMPPPQAPSIAAPTVPSASAAASFAPPAASSELPAPSAEPHGCVFSSARWPGEKTRLRFDASSPPFAEVTGGRVSQLELPLGPASQGASLQTDAWGVLVQGNVAAAEVPLHPRAAFAIGEFLVPYGSATLRWLEGKQGALRVSLQPERRVRPLAGPLQAERPCADVDLTPGSFDAAGVIGRPLANEHLLLRGRRKVAMALTPGGKAAVELDLLRDKDTEVDVLVLETGHARIAWAGDEGWVFGWVPRSALVKAGDQVGEAFGTGGLGLSGRGRGVLLTCAHDVPLFASVAGSMRPVGKVLAGTGIDRVRTRGDHIAVLFPDSTVAPIAPAEFLVEAAQLSGCH